MPARCFNSAMMKKVTLSWAHATSLKNFLVVFLIVGALTFGAVFYHSGKIISNIKSFVHKFNTNPEEEVDYISKYLDVRWIVKENIQYFAKHILVIKNTGKTAIFDTGWRIYFHHIRILEPVMDLDIDDRYQHNIALGNSGLMVTHVSGMLFCIFPDPSNFYPIYPGEELDIPITSSHFQLSRTDVYPNWYVIVPGASPKIITSTSGESLQFVADFQRPEQWKRGESDVHNPYSSLERFNYTQSLTDLKRRGKLIIPTPEEVELSTKSLIINPDEWIIVDAGKFSHQAKYISDKLGIKIASRRTYTKKILLSKGMPSFKKKSNITTNEGYKLNISPSPENIVVTAPSGAGIFNGIQTLLNLAERETTSKKIKVQCVTITDRPRFNYRGLMLDLSRNFHTKKTLLKLIDAMAIYKLNKLHLHLSDDDGWRLQIPEIPELTELGSKRCHDETETSCLMPSQGSGPHKDGLGSGYYTVDDYRGILRYADERNIQVIPEIDMPSHMRSAIVSLKKYQREHPGPGGDTYKMTDPEDGNNYRSAQGHNDNSANPCREGLYKFIDTILTTLVNLHKDIQPLSLFHFGGDEVPVRALKDMKCPVRDRGERDINKYFIKRIVGNERFVNLSYGAWEDGMLQGDKTPYQLTDLGNKRDLYAYVWTEHNKALFRMANEGYKVINSRGAYLYFDHPYEPDPEERGLYWATRYIDTLKVFMFDPLNGTEGYGTLERPENIIGIQGQLWTELIRTEDQLEYMTFPRLLALAERAWYTPDWLETGDKVAQNNDWVNFTNTVSYQEFPRLDKMGVKYRLPPPGAVISNGRLHVATDYPGLPVEYRLADHNQPWRRVLGGEIIIKPIVLRTLSPDGKRHSREVRLVPPEYTKSMETELIKNRAIE